MFRNIKRRLTEHVTFRFLFWRITVYGNNAMHWAVNIKTRKWGYICLRPPQRHWGWYFYLSPNGTPWAATLAVGPGVDSEDKAKTHMRRFWLGHGFDSEAKYNKLMHINRFYPRDNDEWKRPGIDF